MVYVNKNRYLEEMISKYSDMIYRLAMARTGHKENAEDVFQEVFLRLSKKMPKFKSEEHEKAWLIRVTINCSKNLLGCAFLKHKSETEQELTFQTEERHDIYYAVSELSLKYRTIIYLYYYEGYKINEICKILKLKENTVKSQLARAREQLINKIEGGFEDE